uniref:ATPase AAA-type core domain-containing protein n=1 Tax=candidate division WOR-3 bacterium TaxID=2052148 RepID=A0A7V3KPS3_UNCW3
MIVFKSIELKGFRNINHIRIKDLRDLNIFIGPNNCGKTNFLEFISNLSSRLNLGGRYLCNECENFRKSKGIESVYLSLSTEDFYLKDPSQRMEATLLLNDESVNELVPNVLAKQREKLKFNQSSPCKSYKDEIVMEQMDTDTPLLYAEHYSPFIHEEIIKKVKESILYCQEKRLQSYKDKDFTQYIRERRLTAAQKQRWINFLQKIVDPRINDERYENLIMKIDGKDFETEISKQGSGVRSLVCLAVDILFNPDKRVVLIDEPELGLNPFVKQEFLKFLLNESKEKQIFIATQDPTFVNPVLWKNNNVAVYFYSVISGEFMKIDLNQNQEDPNTFAGYLPHTVSLKDVHIYVEGTSDVYIFQVLLEKYLKQTCENWFEILNKVGVYHLCGDFWSHLLYTIPSPPYKCIIILDGDKKERAKEVCEKYKMATALTSKFDFCEKIEDIGLRLSEGVHPIYCLQENCIEKYIIPDFDCNNPPQNYNKRVDGPKKAEELTEIPGEIRQMFERIFGTLCFGHHKILYPRNQFHVRVGL